MYLIDTQITTNIVSGKYNVRNKKILPICVTRQHRLSAPAGPVVRDNTKRTDWWVRKNIANPVLTVKITSLTRVEACLEFDP